MPRHGDARRLLAGVRAGEQGDRHRGSFFRRADDPVGPYLLSLSCLLIAPRFVRGIHSISRAYSMILRSPLRSALFSLDLSVPVRLSFLLFSSSLPSLSLARKSARRLSLSGAHTTHTYAHTHARAPHVVLLLPVCLTLFLSSFPLLLPLFYLSCSSFHAFVVSVSRAHAAAPRRRVLLLFFFSFRLSSTSSSSSPRLRFPGD